VEEERVEQDHATRRPVSGFFVALLLVLFAASGLLAGVYTRQVANASAGAPLTSASPTAISTASATASLTPAARGPFELVLSATPSALKAGQSLQVQALARVPHTDTPVAGIRCTLGQQSTSVPQLVPTWPDPQVTSASGQVAWILTIAAGTAPGPYTLEVAGDSAPYDSTSYSGHWLTTVTVLS
jgi:hypothetical protein